MRPLFAALRRHSGKQLLYPLFSLRIQYEASVNCALNPIEHATPQALLLVPGPLSNTAGDHSRETLLVATLTRCPPGAAGRTTTRGSARVGGLWQVLAHPPRFEPVVEGARTSARLHRSCPFGPTRTWSHTRHAQGLCVVSTIARNSLIIWDAERRRGRRKQRGGAVGYGRYRTLQTPEIQPSSRGREHRRNRGAECDPRPFSRSAHRRYVRAGRKCRGCARRPTTTAARVLTRLLGPGGG